MKVKETLKISPEEEIDTVVSLEQVEESKLINEINDYIVTESLSEYFLKFLSPYNSGRENTGVWVSGFYGSGKSYFAKMVGYLLSNPELKGKEFRNRFKERLFDLSNASLVKDQISKLERVTSHVPMLNLATITEHVSRQGLVRTIYERFLNHLGYEGSLIGVGQLEFELAQNNDYENFKKIVKKQQGSSWENLKDNRPSAVINVMKKALVEMKPNKYSKSTFGDSYESVKERYSEISSTELAKQLNKYISGKRGQNRIVIVIDEVGQFIRGDKSGDRLLELQGIAESFKNIGRGKLWLLVTAQEKLSTVLDEVDIKKSDVSKISDRFKTPIHLKSEDVQQVLDERIFKKTKDGLKKLESLYDKYTGNISDLASPESTKDIADAKKFEKFSI
ncbi:MAG: DUF6079 family protein, partial [Candidatus Paceibacterota bacterium]